MPAWKTLSRSTILEHSKYLVIEEHTIELGDGQVIADWPWIITPDYVIVVAVTEDGEFLCFRQTKYGLDGASLAPVGGYLEPGEGPLNAARRELLEETGCEASEWLNIGSYRVDANRGAGTAHLFLAQDARRVAEPKSDDLEEQRLLRLNRSEMEAALRAQRFKALPWAAAVALGLRRLDDENPTADF